MTDAAIGSAPPSELTATITIAAPPAQVWALVSDLRRMAEWSPQVARTLVRPEPIRLGSRMFNLNREGWRYWPTTATVVRFEPHREIAFRVTENRAVWSFELEPLDGGTLVTHRRETPDGTTAISKALIGLAMGGTKEFEPRLLAGMTQTLRRIKAEAETRV